MQIEKLGFVEGVFIEEIKNRFRCLVSVDGVQKICYVPSSCRLSNFIEFQNKKVLLQSNASITLKTEYTIFAVENRNGYILLNLSSANAIIADQLYRRYFSFLGKRKQLQREVMIGNYKADIYVKDTDTIIEVKTILSENRETVFPTVFSARALQQLNIINELLVMGKKVCYIFVSMNPYTKKVRLIKNTQFYNAFLKCVSNGMTYTGYALSMGENSIEISSTIEIIK